MLTTDLLRVRIVRGVVRPRYVDPDDPELSALAERLIALFVDHRGLERGRLAAELAALTGTGTAFLLHRGLAKLLYDRSTFATGTEREPEELRRAAFAAAARAYRAASPGSLRFDRAAALAAAAGELELEPEAVEAGLYADLKDEQVMVELEPLSARRLLARYNLALAQAVLLRAVELTVELDERDPLRCRALFRKLKFFRLLATIERRRAGRWRITLDGPLSLFSASQRYGLKMASFLPTLLHFPRWKLEAELVWGKRRQRKLFRLSPADGLEPHGHLTGQWQPEEVAAFGDRFAALESGWRISADAEPIDLGGRDVVVPDYVFRHPDGTEVAMEVLGFWRRGAVDARLSLLAEHGPESFILALSKALAAGRDDLDELPGEIYLFRRQPLPRQVLAILEGMRPGLSSG